MQRILFQIRPFHMRDLDQAASAVNRAIYSAYAFFGYPFPVSVTRGRLLDSLASGEKFWVPEANGAVVGILSLTSHYVEKLFIAPEWQGKGLGATLLGHAKTLYPAYLELDCFQENHAACRFYERHGFKARRYKPHDLPAIPQVIYRWQGKA